MRHRHISRRLQLLLGVGEHLLLQFLLRGSCGDGSFALMDHPICSLFQAGVRGIGVGLANAAAPHERVRDWVGRRHAVRGFEAARFVADH